MSASAADLAVKVIGISDDTVRVVEDQKNEIKVRLAGIDAPEFSQAFGTKSKETLSEKVFGKKVKLKSHGMEKPRDGRLRSYTWHIETRRQEHQPGNGGEGWAWQYVQYDNSAELRTAEEKPRK
jgi:micrococcal nuclease